MDNFEGQRLAGGPLGQGPERRAPRSHRALFPRGKPDIDKLARSTLDSLTGIVFDDDARVAQLELRKVQRVRCFPSVAWRTEQAAAVLEILDEELEERGCRRIGFEDGAQLMLTFRRGGSDIATV